MAVRRGQARRVAISAAAKRLDYLFLSTVCIAVTSLAAHDLLVMRGTEGKVAYWYTIKKSCAPGLSWEIASLNMTLSIFGRTTSLYPGAAGLD